MSKFILRLPVLVATAYSVYYIKTFGVNLEAILAVTAGTLLLLKDFVKLVTKDENYVR